MASWWVGIGEAPGYGRDCRGRGVGEGIPDGVRDTGDVGMFVEGTDCILKSLVSEVSFLS